MKKYFLSICWILGGIIWSLAAWSFFSEGRTGLALVQCVCAALFFMHGVRGCLNRG